MNELEICQERIERMWQSQYKELKFVENCQEDDNEMVYKIQCSEGEKDIEIVVFDLKENGKLYFDNQEFDINCPLARFGVKLKKGIHCIKIHIKNYNVLRLTIGQVGGILVDKTIKK